MWSIARNVPAENPRGEGGARSATDEGFLKGKALRANPHPNPFPVPRQARDEGRGANLARVRRPRDASVLPLGGGRRHCPFSLGRESGARSATDEGFFRGEGALRGNPHPNPSPVGEGQALVRVRRPRDTSVLPLGVAGDTVPSSSGRRWREAPDEGFLEGKSFASPHPNPSPVRKGTRAASCAP